MWLEDQKKRYRNGTLSAERKARLDKMGYPFVPEKSPNAETRKSQAGIQKKNWFANAEKVLAFAEHHTSDELHIDTVYDGLNIYYWVHSQRKRYETGKITDEQQIEILQRILQTFQKNESIHKE